MRIIFNTFSQRGTGKAHNEDAVLLDGQVLQGRVREHGAVDISQPHFFAVAAGLCGPQCQRLQSVAPGGWCR